MFCHYSFGDKQSGRIGGDPRPWFGASFKSVVDAYKTGRVEGTQSLAARPWMEAHAPRMGTKEQTRYFSTECIGCCLHAPIPRSVSVCYSIFSAVVIRGHVI